MGELKPERDDKDVYSGVGLRTAAQWAISVSTSNAWILAPKYHFPLKETEAP
jgi:hypothetical protein